MYNLNADTFKPPPQTSSEIAKSIKQSFDGASRPVYDAEKRIKQRTDTNLHFVRHKDDWMKNFERREEQKKKGFFSVFAQPYDELGETELVAKDLIINAMTDIGVVFKTQDFETNPDGKSEATNYELPKKKLDMENPKKESPTKQLLTPNEVSDSGSSTIKELLDKAERRIKDIKAGRPLAKCLRDESKEEKCQKRKQKDTRAGSSTLSLQSPDQFVEEEGSTDEMTSSKRQQDNRFRKAFLAKLEWLETIFNCVLNTKNKDLRNKTPLSREALRLIRNAENVEGPQGIMGISRLPRLSAVPAIIFASNKNHRIQSSAINEPDLMPILDRNSNITYTDDANSRSSKIQLNATDASLNKAAAASVHASKNWVHLSTSRTSQPYYGAGSLRLETWEDFVAMHSDPIKSDSSAGDADAGRLGKPGTANYSKAIRLLKPRRGAVFQSKGNLDLPIWQRVIQDEMKREELKAGRKVKDFTKKKDVNGEAMLKEVKQAFVKTKNKSLDKLERELEIKINCFKERMNFFKLSLLPDEDLKYMRRMVKCWQSELSGDGETVRPVRWYESLTNEQKHLGLQHDVEITSKLKDIMRFTKLEISTISNLKAKLCLLVMSFPVYDVCLHPMQDAIKFFLSSIMEISSNYLEDWMLNRKLLTNNILAK